MENLRTDQILIVLVFMAVLGAVWLWARRNRHGLSRRLAGASRLRLSEVAALSPTDRAMILAVDGQEFLIVRMKGATPVVTPLSPAAVAGGAA